MNAPAVLKLSRNDQLTHHVSHLKAQTLVPLQSVTAELSKLLVPPHSITREKYQEERPSAREHAPREEHLASTSSTFENTRPSVRGVISHALLLAISRVFAPEVGSPDSELL